MLAEDADRRACPDRAGRPRDPGGGDGGALGRGVTILQGVVAAVSVATVAAGGIAHLSGRLGYLEWEGAARADRIRTLEARSVSQDDLLNGMRADLRAVRTDVRWLRERMVRVRASD